MNDQAEFEVKRNRLFSIKRTICYLDQSTHSIERCFQTRLRQFNSMVSQIKWISR